MGEPDELLSRSASFTDFKTMDAIAQRDETQLEIKAGDLDLSRSDMLLPDVNLGNDSDSNGI